MKILYKDPEDHTLCVMEVTGTTYYQEEGILEFTGDSDIGIQVSEAEAEKVVRLLFDTDQADLTNYNTCVVEIWTMKTKTDTVCLTGSHFRRNKCLDQSPGQGNTEIQGVSCPGLYSS